MKILLKVTVIALLISCQTNKQMKSADSGSSSQDKSLVISMKKTMCYGKCPVYEIEIYDDLTVLFSGEKNVDLIGVYTASIDDSIYDSLVKKFNDANFFTFQKEYKKAVSDLPTTYLFFSDGAKSMKVKDYYGAPDSLKALEKSVADLIPELEWSRSNE